MSRRRVPEFDAELHKAGRRMFERQPWFNPRTGRTEPRVLGRRVAMRFRVSRGLWDQTFAAIVPAGMELHYGGYPIVVDDALPGEVALLEETGYADD